MISARVVGLDDLKRLFANLPTEVGKKVLRRGASAATKVIKPAVIAETPVAVGPHRKGATPGLLKRAVIVKFIREQSNDEQAFYIVTFRQGKAQQKLKRGNLDAYYAKFVERGHRIVPRKRRGDKRTRRARAAASTRFVQGSFFFKKALEKSNAAAMQAMITTMQREIAKVLPR